MNIPRATADSPDVRVTGWRLAAGVFGVAVIVLLVCQWRVAASLVGAWLHDGSYQYAILIFPISLWVAFDLRDRLLARAPSPSFWGLAAVALLACIAFAGRMLAVNLPQHFALVAMFPALVLACWGWRALRVLAFPLGYLVAFAVPWGDGLVGPLQDITARIAVGALNLTGYSVLLNGREIMTPSAVWMVADACSGVKFFLACTALGCLYAWLLYRHAWKRVVFVLASAIVPVLANGLRVYFTVVIGETWGLHYATGTDHLVFGWQFFGTVLVLLLWAGWFFRDSVMRREGLPVDARKVSGPRVWIWPAVLVLLVAGALGASPTPGGTLRTVHVDAPVLAGWGGSVAVGDGWRPRFAGASGQVRVDYQATSGDGVVALFHAVYVGRPRRGHELVTYGNNVYDPVGARVLASTRVSVVFDGGTRATVRELRLSGDAGAQLLWYWYCVNGRCTSSPIETKLLQAWDVVRGRVPRSSVWALSVPVAGSDVGVGRARLREFARLLPLGATTWVHSAGDLPAGVAAQP